MRALELDDVFDRAYPFSIVTRRAKGVTVESSATGAQMAGVSRVSTGKTAWLTLAFLTAAGFWFFVAFPYLTLTAETLFLYDGERGWILERFSDSLGSDWARDERRERRGEVRRERVVDTAVECLQRFSPAECRNCFRHCGYSIATQS